MRNLLALGAMAASLAVAHAGFGDSCSRLRISEFIAGDLDSIALKAFAINNSLHVFGRFQTAGANWVAGAAVWTGAGWRKLDQQSEREYGGLNDVAIYQNTVVGVGPNWEYPYDPQVIQWTGTQWVCLHKPSNLSPDLVAVDGKTIAIAQQWDWDDYSGGVEIRQDNEWRMLPTPRGSIEKMMFFDGSLVLAGYFQNSEEDNAPRSVLIRWNGLEWEDLGFPGLSPRALLAHDGILYAATEASQDEPDTHPPTVWSFKGDWSPLPSVTTGGNPASLGLYNGKLVVAGNFTSIDGTPANRIAVWDGLGWSALGDGIGGPNAYVGGIAQWGEQLVAVGYFSLADGKRVNHIARWDGGGWHSFGAIGNGVASEVSSAVGFKGNLFIAGGELAAGDMVSQGVARWDGTAWHAANENLSGYVRELVPAGGTLYAVGYFPNGGDPHEIFQDLVLARRVADRWEVVPGMFGYPREAVPFGKGVALLGVFHNDDGDEFDVAIWDGQSWKTADVPDGWYAGEMVEYRGKLMLDYAYSDDDGYHLGGLTTLEETGWQPFFPQPEVGADALAVVNGKLYISQSSLVGRLDEDTWTNLPSLTVGSSPDVLTSLCGDLIAGGTYAWQVPGGEWEGGSAARWNGMSWDYLCQYVYGGPDRATCVVGNADRLEIYCVGFFNRIDGRDVQNRVARYPSCRCVGDWNADGVINAKELSTLLALFGRITSHPYEPGDSDGDALVSIDDLIMLLSRYGNSCQ